MSKLNPAGFLIASLPPPCLRLVGRTLPVLTLTLAGWSNAAALDPATDGLAAALPELPARWSQTFAAADMPSATADPAALARWWNVFGDAALGDRIEQALRSGHSVRSALAALEQARALRDVAQAGRWPELGASASVQRSRSGDGPASRSWRAGLDAGWDADLFGQQAGRIDAGEADLLAARYAMEQTRIELAAEVAQTYLELRGLQARLAIARASLAAQQQTLQITDWRVRAGLASSLDLEQARAAAEQTRAQLPALQSSLDRTAHALAVLGGQLPTATQSLREAVQPVPLPDRMLVLSFPADTLRQRADLRAAEQRVRAALARVRQADAARWPGLRLGGSIGLAAARPSDLLDAASIARGLLASLSGTLFDGGAARAQLRAQQAALEQSRIGYGSALLGALQQVEDALAALRGDRERLQRLQAAAEAAANAELFARQRYASGLIDFRTVLDTQRTLLSVQSELETTRAALAADHVRLYLALGGGWTPDAVMTSEPR
jgi:outer membrane protein, multidrug efflux system